MSDLPALMPETFINRELSTVEFNRRVLALAQDRSVPLLERVKFLAIVGSNLDEFFMVRVSSYLQKIKMGIARTRPDGYTPNQLLHEIRVRTTEIMNIQRATMREVLDELEQHGICFRNISDLKPHQKEAARTYFAEEIFPVLTPLAADHARPFPFISNLSLNLGVYLDREGYHHHNGSHYEFVRIKIPEALPRMIDLYQIVRRYGSVPASDEDRFYIWVEEIISENLDLLFPGMRVMENHPFRVTRNADIDYEHEKEEDLYDISAIIEASVRDRRFGSVVRLSVPESISERMLNRLIYELEVEPERDVYIVQGVLGSASLFELYNIDRPDLKYPPYVPKAPEALPQGMNIFEAIRKNDILIHLPYDSFSPVEEFFRAAAHDPQVLAIKATLYRVGKNSPIVQYLMEARDNDKQVAVLVELKARFDEENNLEWARALEHKGVHVTYGVEELTVKTHAKIALVVRKEGDGLRRYVHLGTGNYNASTARMYSDFGLFTCHTEIGDDASRLFNRLTGYAPKTNYKRLLVAPEYLLKSLLQLMDNEIKAAQKGKFARLIFKMNQLEEDTIIQKLYQASQAGVKIDLIVRGLCCLRPGVPGVSENIRVISILGRFLEHSRVYYFENAPPHQQIYLGSADLMRRNLYNRVETVFPVIDPRLQKRILHIFGTELHSNVEVWELQPDGLYIPVRPAENQEALESQAVYMQDSFGLKLMP
jgi:polyphosphate kinase